LRETNVISSLFNFKEQKMYHPPKNREKREQIKPKKKKASQKAIPKSQSWTVLSYMPINKQI
jgi:hypothetical protein